MSSCWACSYWPSWYRSVARLLSDPPPGGYPQPLAAVIATSMLRLEQTDPAAVALLQLCAMLAPEPIPLRWFSPPPPGPVRPRGAT